MSLNPNLELDPDTLELQDLVDQEPELLADPVVQDDLLALPPSRRQAAARQLAVGACS